MEHFLSQTEIIQFHFCLESSVANQVSQKTLEISSPSSLTSGILSILLPMSITQSEPCDRHLSFIVENGTFQADRRNWTVP